MKAIEFLKAQGYKNIRQCLIDKDILNYEFCDEVDNDECFITFDYCLN